MINDVTPKFLEKKYKEDKLGYLKISIPIKPHKKEPDILNGCLELSLQKLYENVVSDKNLDDGLHKMEAICIYGSTIYKPVGYISPGEMPNDLDLMVILESSPDGKDIIIPEK